MQISKLLVVVCAATCCLGLSPLQAAETEAQIKAREALEKKLDELNSKPQRVEVPAPVQPAAPAPKTVPVAAPAPAVVPAPAPVHQTARPVPPAAQIAPVTKPAEAPAPFAVRTPAEVEAQAKALEALKHKMVEMDGQPATATNAPANPPIVIKPAAPPVQVKTPEPVVTPEATKPVVVAPVQTPAPAFSTPAEHPELLSTQAGSEAAARAREAMKQTLEQIQTKPVVKANSTVTAKPAAVVQTTSTAKPAAANLTARHWAPPEDSAPPPISGEKLRLLNELTAKYMKDQISPEQFTYRKGEAPRAVICAPGTTPLVPELSTVATV